MVGRQPDHDALRLSLDATLLSDSEETFPLAYSLSPTLQSNSWRWLWLGLIVSCTLGSVAVLAFVWMALLPPETDCQTISARSPDRQQLSCAQWAAQSQELSQLVAGLKLVEQWTPEHPLYYEAQQSMAQWSEAVLDLAHHKAAEQDLQGAIAIAVQIPPSSPTYPQATAAIAQWETQRHVGEAIYEKAQTALKNQDWDQVSEQILALSALDDPYWNTQQVNVLSQQLITEKQARRTLEQAQKWAQMGNPEQLSTAVTAVSQIDPKSYASADAQAFFDQWGEALLTLGLQKWQAGQLDQAIALAKRVSLNPALSEEAQNLLQLSQARKLAFASGGNWQVTPTHIWNLMEAIAAVRQIQPQSQFYQAAQTSLASWEVQLANLNQLQLAQLVAGLGQPQLLKAAIAQAQTIAPNHPRRLQAQTLIAHWQHELERLEDQPILARAQQWAATGEIESLRAAIAEASQIVLGRALRDEAQALIYSWHRQIQVLEDQSLLRLARSRASQGNLQHAIQTANRIRPDRALYAQAQTAIRDWQTELQRIETTNQPTTEATPSLQANLPRRVENQRPAKPEAPAQTIPHRSNFSTPPLQSTQPSPILIEVPSPTPNGSPAVAGDRSELTPPLPTAIETYPTPLPESAPPTPDPSLSTDTLASPVAVPPPPVLVSPPTTHEKPRVF